jgi:23S rRNA (uridine2552-2'-O)-methyltransferase
MVRCDKIATVYKRKDFYYLKAKEEGYLSRAAYKLLEITGSYNIIKENDRVVDIGCSPGGWSQVASKIVGKGGKVIGVDLVEPAKFSAENFVFIQGDITQPLVQEMILKELNGKADAVLSDASPKLSGIRERDHIRSIEIIQAVIDVAMGVLKVNGNMLTKMIEGPEKQGILKRIQQKFTFTKLFRPDSTRRSSRENYIIAKGFHGA